MHGELAVKPKDITRASDDYKIMKRTILNEGTNIYESSVGFENIARDDPKIFRMCSVCGLCGM